MISFFFSIYDLIPIKKIFKYNIDLNYNYFFLIFSSTFFEIFYETKKKKIKSK